MKYRILLVTALILSFVINLSAQQANHLVISEVFYLGSIGGEFVELYNPTGSDITLTGITLQSGTGTNSSSNTGDWTVDLANKTIKAYGYLLIGGSLITPIPDALMPSGKELKNSGIRAGIRLNNSTIGTVVDAVGWDQTAVGLFEGSAFTLAGTTSSVPKSIERKALSSSTQASMSAEDANFGNGYDSNDNSIDFVLRDIPQPQNSASPIEQPSSGPDVIPPTILVLKTPSETQIDITFSEAVDSVTSTTSTNYSLDNSATVSRAVRNSANPSKVSLTVSTMTNRVYTLTVRNVKDTSNNAITSLSIKFCYGAVKISDARALGIGASVRVRGTITLGNEFGAPPAYIQDSTGAIAVFNYNLMTSVKRGDIWEVAGTLKDYYGLMEIDPLTDSLKISSGNSLPNPKLLKSSELNGTYESQLVRINKVKFALPGSFSTLVDSVYAAGDAFGPLNVLVSKGSNIAGSPIPSDSVNLIGLVNDHDSVYSLLPRMLADINVIDPPSSQTWLDINISRSKDTSTVVKVRGIVTYAQPSKTAGKMTIFIQDFSGGISIYDPKADTLKRGDSIEVKGALYLYSGLTEIINVDSLRLFARGLPLPAPKIITLAQASEAYESQLVKIFGVRFQETGTFSGGTSGTTYNVTDGSTQLNVRIPYGSALAGRMIPSGLLDIVGVMGQYGTAYQLIPRDSADLIVYPGPQISSNPTITAVTDTSFTVGWSTFFSGTSVVYFGKTSALGDSVVVSTQATSHSITVSKLKPGRIYYYQVYSANNLGTAASFVASQVTTSSASSGQMNVYFNYSVDASYGIKPLANGNTDLLGKLLERISNAKNTIDLAVYSFDDFGGGPPWVANLIADSLVAVKNRNVKVRVVFDYKSLTTPINKLISAGISVMQRPDPGANGGIMHNKIFIFDGRDTTDATDDWVIMGSWNFTNSGTLADAQNAVFIQDQSLARIYTAEFEEMFGSSTETKNSTLAHFGPAKSDNTPHVTYIGSKKVKVEIFFSPSDGTTSNIIRALGTGDKDIFFGVMSFTRTDIAQKLIDKKNAGVRVRGMIDQPPNVLGTLQAAGVDALDAGHSVVTGIFHHKYAVVDPFNDESDPLVITGSHNWSNAAEQDNDENTLIIHSGDIARQYAQEFTKRYKESGGLGVITGVEKISSVHPVRFDVSQNYPNPFNPTTNFQFQIPVSGLVSIKVFDILGREVAILLNEVKPVGVYQITWNASALPSGVYFYRVQSGTNNTVKKAVLLK